ncbi:MAG: STAS domain-containing protein [Candidatus Tumulicola sp.]
MIDQTPETKTVSFKLVGEWDFLRRNELRAMLSPAESADEVLLDFSEATFIDASVLGDLIHLLKRVTERNRLGTVRIVAASRRATRIFELCNLQELFGLPESTHAACVGNRQLTSRMQSDALLVTA